MLPEYFAYVTIILGLLGSYLYIKDTFLGKTRPNRVSWIFWTIAPFVGVYISYKTGASFLLLLSTFMAGFTPLLIVIASFFNKNAYWKTTTFDIICGSFSALAIVIWIITSNAILSISFAILADLFAGIPTIFKSWKYSDTENSTPYVFGIINQIITLLIITQFTFSNTGFPIYLVCMNVVIILGIYRKKIFS